MLYIKIKIYDVAYPYIIKLILTHGNKHNWKKHWHMKSHSTDVSTYYLLTSIRITDPSWEVVRGRQRI